MSQDPKGREFLPGPLTLEQVESFIQAAAAHQKSYGYAPWAVELKKEGAFIGYIGLKNVDFSAPFTPAVEIGWRLGTQYWGKGYASEGAKAALDYGCQLCGLKEIVAFTVPANSRSIRVMEKIGLQRDFDGDFSHPKLEKTHFLSRHVLYRFTCKQSSCI